MGEIFGDGGRPRVIFAWKDTGELFHRFRNYRIQGKKRRLSLDRIRSNFNRTICSENWNRIKIALILSVLIEIFFFEILIKISFPLIRNANLRRLPLVNKKLRENTGI